MVSAPVTTGAPQPEGLRERKKAHTRRALHRAALHLVHERGLSAVTTEAIAEAADVSQRTFFNYYPTKESAVLGADPRSADRVADELRDRLAAGETAAAAVRGCFTSWVLDFTADRELWLIRRTVIRGDPQLLQAMAAIASAIEDALTDALAEAMGVDRHTDLRPGVLVAATWAAIRVGMGSTRERDDLTLEQAMSAGIALLGDRELFEPADAAAAGS